MAAEHDRHVEPAGADRDHPEAPGLGRVGVGAEHRLARFAVALHVDVVTDPVSRPREVEPVLLRERLEHPVVVGILVVQLHDVVVDVLHRPLDLEPRHSEFLELHQRHRPGGVLQQRLVHPQRDRAPRLELALCQVLGEDLPCEAGHPYSLPRRGMI